MDSVKYLLNLREILENIYLIREYFFSEHLLNDASKYCQYISLTLK